MLSSSFFKKIINKKVIALVSGGLDSMVLLSDLQNAQKKISFDLLVIHFNHHLRQDESDRDAQFVRKYCQQTKIPFKVIDLQFTSKNSIQEKARDARRDELKTLLKKTAYDFIVSAHHADDQLETYLMRQERGAGIRGLAGIRESALFFNQTFWLHPLLKYSKEDLREYANKRGILSIEDSSNAQKKYTRNRIRHDVVPLFKQKNPNWKKWIIAETLKNQKQSDGFQKKAEQFLTKKISRKSYLSLHAEVQFRVLERLLQNAGYQKQFEKKLFEELHQFLKSKKHFEKKMGAFVFWGADDGFGVQKEFKDVFISIPQKNKSVILLDNNQTLVMQEEKYYPTPNKIFLKKDIQFPLILRSVKAGDRLAPLGLKGKTQLVSDFFTNKKIPRLFRKKYLIVESQKEIAGILGIGPTEFYKVEGVGKLALSLYTAT